MSRHAWSPTAAAALALLAGCRGTPIASEREARASLADVTSRYRPGGSRPPLPPLSPESPLSAYLTYALLNNPEVEAAYFEWAAGVERITTARSLPDPALTFEADIGDTVTALLPGLMLELPGPGKLRAAGDVAAAESTGLYFRFEQEVLRTADRLKAAYYRLHFLEENVRVQKDVFELLETIEELARHQNAAGKVTLQDVLRAQIERDQLATQIANLEDSRQPLLAEFKAALGLERHDPDPPAPSSFEPSPGDPDSEALWASAVRRNPALRAMEAAVRRAEAALDLARKTGVPDFTIGFEADAKASPVFYRPSASMTLPIWRDKIEAAIAEAEAQKRAAEARLSSEQIELATELAALLFAYRESVRTIDLLSNRLVPKARQSLDVARAGYVTGRTGFLDLIDAEESLLSFELSLIESRTQRELSLSSLSLVIAGQPPAGAPVLEDPRS